MLLSAVLVCSASEPAFAEQTIDLRAPRWGEGFSAVRTVSFTPGQLAGIAARIGARPRAIWNHFVKDAEGLLQVNVIEAGSAAEARRIFSTLAAAPGARERFVLRERFLVELVRGSPLQRHRMLLGLGLLDRSLRRYRVSARLGLLARGDAGVVNQLFNLLLARKQGRAVPDGAIARIVAGLGFGEVLRVRAAPTSGGLPRYRFKPAPRARTARGAVELLRFGVTRQQDGIPFVELEAEVATRGFSPVPTPTPPGAALTAATPRWPTRAPEVVRLSARLRRPGEPPARTLERVHAFVERELRYGGPMGTRDGVLRVLARGHGRCWDKADVLVTLLRAAGIPARQVAGWLLGGDGHIWAEAWVAGTGWVQVDATAPYLGVGGGHLPLFLTEDGELPVLYLERPVIRER
jgi:transglutaminase-like putative cysteine protease